MILVVLCHVAGFGLGLAGASDVTSYHTILGQFRMPLFFFVSGFVLFKHAYNWNPTNTLHFLKKKINVQIISPFLFLLASVTTRGLILSDALIDPQKAGYWFTFTLFEYYMLYILIHTLVDACRLENYAKDICLLILALGLYVITVPTMIERWPFPKEFRGFIGVSQLGYFFFFMLGTRIRKYFSLFEKALDYTPLIMTCVLIFFGFNVFSHWVRLISSTGFKLLTSLSGIIIVISFFRQEKEIFSKEHYLGRIFQYIGRRTLDIYLIHYFFIFSNMGVILPNFGQLNSPLIEFCLSLLISVCVISACLIVSKILRMSPTLAHFLFGQKNISK